jgi:glycosyltransferase involved in cell wall biosynthesis
MTPLFSIVIPSLNSGAFIERALMSVMSQAGDDTEVIVVDGGSTDGTVGLLGKYADESSKVLKFESSKVEEVGGQRSEVGDQPIRQSGTNAITQFSWLSEPDGGQSEALNKGFVRARGKYLFWVNADDLLLPGTLDRLRAYLSQHPDCAWVAGNLIYMDEQDRMLWCARDGQWHDWLYRHAPVRVYGPSSVFSRELFNRVGGFDESLHYVMDTDLWLRV